MVRRSAQKGGDFLLEMIFDDIISFYIFNILKVRQLKERFSDQY